MQNRFPILAALSIFMLMASACNMPLTPVPGSTPAVVPGVATNSAGQGVPNTGGTGATQIALAQTGRYGAILVDGSGRTLYMFAKDGPNTPTCLGACARLWPPFVSASGGISAQTGITSNQIGTVVRPDGTRQVVYNGHPLYYFSRDAAPGEMKGEGLKGLWFVVSPDGEPIEK